MSERKNIGEAGRMTQEPDAKPKKVLRQLGSLRQGEERIDQSFIQTRPVASLEYRDGKRILVTCVTTSEQLAEALSTDKLRRRLEMGSIVVSRKCLNEAIISLERQSSEATVKGKKEKIKSDIKLLKELKNKPVSGFVS